MTQTAKKLRASSPPFSGERMSKAFIDLENLNYLQIGSLRKLRRLAKDAHMIDVVIRVNGQNETVQADFLKYIEFDGSLPKSQEPQ